MANTEFNSVATAIRSAELEGFMAGTLYDQGWSVTLRALDMQSLLNYLDSNPRSISLLLISTDVEGLTLESLEEIKKRKVNYFLFAATSASHDQFPEALEKPATALELLGLIRGSHRSPMIRSSKREKIRARTIAVASPTPSVGSTTLTINLGAELAQLGRRVLIVDAHAYYPSFAIRLGERGLNTSTEFRNISAELWALEITQSEISEGISALDRALTEFDFILIDHGPINDFPTILTSRRWCSETFVWISTHADELWIMSKSDPIAIDRLRTLTQELLRNSIKPQLTFLQIQQGLGKKSRAINESFLQLVTPLRPQRILQYPWDSRSTAAAEEEQSTLFESNEKGALRKSIAHVAGELAS